MNSTSVTGDDRHELDPKHAKPTLVYNCPVDHSGTHAYVKGWHRAAANGRAVIIIHDLGEDLTLYRPIARYFYASGISAYTFDIRGHGRSGRRLGHVDRFDDFLGDLLQIVAWVRHLERGHPPTLLGEGFGAVIAAAFAARYERYVDRLVCVAPTFYPRRTVSRLWKAGLRLLGETFPTLRLPVALQVQASPRPEFQVMTARLAQVLIGVFEETPQMLTRGWTTPTLMAVPSQDTLCHYQSLREWSAGQDHVTWVDLDVPGHAMLRNSKASARLVADTVIGWLSPAHGGESDA